MKATELRIGNLVDFYDESGKDLLPFKKHKLTIYNILRIVEDDATFEPIPLTEEWLVKFGFNKDEVDDCYWYELKLNIITLVSTELGNDEKYLYVFDFEYDKLRIKYVHQLQNLYFELTRKEIIL